MFKSLKNDTNWQVITIDHLSDLTEISRLPVVYLQPSTVYVSRFWLSQVCIFWRKKIYNMAPKSMVKVQSINLYCILQKVINTIKKRLDYKKKTSTVYNMISIYTDTCTFEPTYWYMYCTVCMQIPVNLQNTVV